MFSTNKFRLFFLSLAFLVLAGCSSLPTELTAKTEPVITDYQLWLDADPDTKPDVRLGGVIASVQNLDDKTRIEVVNLPIDSNGKPDLDAEPKGRFVAYISGYAEPVSFAKGRMLTIVGTTAMPETGLVGEYEYTFPVMNAYGQRLWQIKERIVVTDTTSHYYSCRSMYCRSFNYGPKQGRVIQEVK
ncbi:Slp family lipoprotein [Vibrio sp. T187]|uniref:Slp family lipoprotein n=1 Tax=Vibrio TaxID=662 RepID=UPI0010C9E291|nr:MULTISPECIES: Slp family lipoprotein [Vibrio]MBW3694480.1 Slp family lipoprotein [Vibrio sp. T187]